MHVFSSRYPYHHAQLPPSPLHCHTPQRTRHTQPSRIHVPPSPPSQHPLSQLTPRHLPLLRFVQLVRPQSHQRTQLKFARRRVIAEKRTDVAEAEVDEEDRVGYWWLGFVVACRRWRVGMGCWEDCGKVVILFYRLATFPLPSSLLPWSIGLRCLVVRCCCWLEV